MSSFISFQLECAKYPPHVTWILQGRCFCVTFFQFRVDSCIQKENLLNPLHISFYHESMKPNFYFDQVMYIWLFETNVAENNLFPQRNGKQFLSLLKLHPSLEPVNKLKVYISLLFFFLIKTLFVEVTITKAITMHSQVL